MKPVAIDLCCGLGGWAEGLLAEGYEVIGYDTEAHDYGTGGYPGTLILQDITTLHGSQFKHAALIVASPPCQAYSYMAMPWSLGKAKAAAIEADESGAARRELNLLFDTCFRIQREASEAAGHHIPMIVENVRGAQKWVGRAKWNYGSFYLWGDVPALMPTTMQLKAPGKNWNEWKDWDGTEENKPASVRPWGDALKNPGGGSWDRSRPSHTADHSWDSGTKNRDSDGYERSHPNAFGWKAPRTTSRGTARKAASAMIAKIPFPLSQHIARTFYPQGQQWGQLPHASDETPALTRVLDASSVVTASTI